MINTYFSQIIEAVITVANKYPMHNVTLLKAQYLNAEETHDTVADADDSNNMSTVLEVTVNEAIHEVTFLVSVAALEDATFSIADEIEEAVQDCVNWELEGT